MTKRRNIFARVMDYIIHLFFNGLFTLLPITLTIVLFNATFKLIKSWLEPIHRMEPQFIKAIPHSEILLTVLLIFFIGTILKFFILRSLVDVIEGLLCKVPLIRPIYSGIKQLIKALNFQDKMSFKKVVLVEFPRDGVYSIGFLTNQMPPELAPNGDTRFFNVFIPTTPNPTSGFFVLVPEKSISYSDMTRHEAMALIISGGIIQPERFVGKQAS